MLGPGGGPYRYLSPVEHVGAGHPQEVDGQGKLDEGLEARIPFKLDVAGQVVEGIHEGGGISLQALDDLHRVYWHRGRTCVEVSEDVGSLAVTQARLDAIAVEFCILVTHGHGPFFSDRGAHP